nr:helix-turn-helix transcriptional regulator [Delftia lacustris]
MRRNGLTQTAAAEALGISRRMLLYYLTGEKPVPAPSPWPAWAGKWSRKTRPDWLLKKDVDCAIIAH